MLEFFQIYGPSILAAIVAAGGAITSVCATIKMFKTEKRVKASEAQTKEDIRVTREGIVEAFKKSKIPTEWKISISKQVDEKLEVWAEKFLIMFKEHEDLRTQLAVANTKILAYTAAFNKLSPEEQTEINELIKQITDGDKTIEV